MKLSFEQLKSITLGAVRIEETETGTEFFRFTKEQEELYKTRSKDLYSQKFATSGIKFSFATNSETLCLKTTVSSGSNRCYFAFDLFVDGVFADSLKNFDESAITLPYTTATFEFGEFEKKFELKKGKKRIDLYFPWSARAVINELCLDDGAVIEPIKPKHKLLCFGDSITQGYDALHPANKYTTKLANWLDAEEYNKAFGGDIFFPELAVTQEDFTPDFISVAYGTNDWNNCFEEEFNSHCTSFFQNLSDNYKNAKIFVITPIWRKDLKDYRKFGDFLTVGKSIKKFAEDFENITVIDGFDFIEQNENLFADLRLHPSDEGFESYFESLIKKMKI